MREFSYPRSNASCEVKNSVNFNADVFCELIPTASINVSASLIFLEIWLYFLPCGDFSINSWFHTSTLFKSANPPVVNARSKFNVAAD